MEMRRKKTCKDCDKMNTNCTVKPKIVNKPKIDTLVRYNPNELSNKV